MRRAAVVRVERVERLVDVARDARDDCDAGGVDEALVAREDLEQRVGPFLLTCSETRS